MRSKPAIAVLGLYLLACVAIAYAGWAGAVKPVESWDEARRGVNAQQMRQFQDYGNYRYLGAYDDFNTKPPLFTWGVAASFELFGVGRSSLRLVSLLAYAVFLLGVLRFLLRRYRVSIAAYSLLILIGVNGVLGDHVALAGDTDMLFVLFTTLGILSYYRWVFEGHGPAGYATAMWIGLAFLTKGPALLLVLPGIGLHYVLCRKNRANRSPITLRLGAFATLVSVLCLVLLLNFQNEGQPWYEQNLLWDTIARDGVTRFTDASLESGYQWDFVFVALDLKFQLYSYLLYALIAYAVWRMGLRQLAAGLSRRPFLLLMICLVGTGMTVLLGSQNKHQWYVAPLIFPLAYVTARGIAWVQNRYRYIAVVPLALFLVLVGQRAHELRMYVQRTEPAIVTPSDTLYLDRAVPQRCVFELQRANPDKLLRSTVGVNIDTLFGAQLVGCPGWTVYAAGEL